MPQVKPNIDPIVKIKIVGVGGGGGSAINRMVAEKIKGVDFIAMNTDVQALHLNSAPQKLHIGQTVTRGLGAGMDPEVGRRAAEESQNEIREILKDADMVFITCGLGGGTGTGAGPMVAEIAKEIGALTVAVVTKPFAWEGPKRSEIAEAGWEEIAKKVDSIITVPNERILQVIDKKTPFTEAFRIADDILRQGVQGISEIITTPGGINVDFADVKTIMRDTGSALMGIGIGKGENKATDAAKAAVSSPLLDLSIDGARGILFTLTGGSDLTMDEVNEAAKIITSSASSDAKIIFGSVIDEDMKDTVKITVVATGFEEKHLRQMSDEDAAKKSFSSGKYTPSPFVIKTQKEEEEKDKKFKQFAQKNINNNAQASANSQFAGIIKNFDDEEELAIPPFIKKKMGI
ncbi:MAG: cell division protein FtsZ [Patescibacteria group bacterium]